jgi:predicted protein tyrosine phosphatase
MSKKRKELNSELENLLTNKTQLHSEYIDKITDKIYLGDIEGFNDFDYFSKEKITHILSLIDVNINIPEFYKIKHKLISIEDEENVNLLKYVKECIEFIESADKIYIHCMCGISRSPSIVIAYLMWKAHCSYYDAYFFVKNRRSYICPNDGFVEQLKLFENLIKKNDYDLNKIDFNNIERCGNSEFFVPLNK